MPGSHRARGDRGALGARSRRLPAILGSAVAVAAVVLVIVLVRVLHHSGSGSAAVASRTPPPSSSVAAATPTPTPTRRSSAPAPVRTTPKPTAVATPAPGAYPVSVYNVSRVQGRAMLATARLERVGYHVQHTANRSYDIGSPVVYYDAGNASTAAAARALVARHLGIGAAAVRPTGIPSNGGLIVIVTASYR